MLRRCTIQNFKSLEDVSVDFGDITIFVGRSGTGKTNLVSALRFLRDYTYFEQHVVEHGNWLELIPAI